MDEDNLTIAKMKLRIPEEKWIFELFDCYRDAELDILNFFPYDFENKIGNAIIEIKHYKIDQIIEILEDHPSIYNLKIMHRKENNVNLNIKTTNPYLLFIVIKCGYY